MERSSAIATVIKALHRRAEEAGQAQASGSGSADEAAVTNVSYVAEVRRINASLGAARAQGSFVPSIYVSGRSHVAHGVRQLLRAASKSCELNLRSRDIERLNEMHEKLWELLSRGERAYITAAEYQEVMTEFNEWRRIQMQSIVGASSEHPESAPRATDGGGDDDEAALEVRRSDVLPRSVDTDTGLGECLYLCSTKLPRPTMELFISCPLYLFNPNAVEITAMYQLFAKRVSLVKSEAELMMWDTNNDGKLTEDELENYVESLVPRVPTLRDLTAAVLPFYCCTVCRRIFWDLDPSNRSFIRIDALLSSSVMDEWVTMQLRTEDNPQNWFGTAVTQQVYDKFMFLDTRSRGTLGADCLRRYKKGLPTVIDDGLPMNVSPLCTLFIDRYFETNSMITNCEMDYRRFVDFVIAIEMLPQCSRPLFFWRILDLDGSGVLTPMCVNYFFKETHAKLVSAGLEVAPREVVVQEVFDLITTAEPLHITREEFLNSPQAGLFVALIIDCLSFWTYENREQR